ncbi:zinc finger, RING/FYVE/PHD-type [Artemisia annua]|uniref:Zinc finger, RING/FYVE/PHD-type n=1 Tax=Artemisia annua TaxID=35608 RepID=A0A2U1N801_ARTAN|nr:zinc finger, RING/FYVE/PHD-type [Artemisia annua]
MRKNYKDSLKALEADIQHANTLALNTIKDDNGGCIQMRLYFSPAADFFPCLFPWADCKIAGAFGLIRVFIYMIYADGKTTMHVHEKRASLRQFYGVVFPSIMQLQSGITDLEERKQKEILLKRYSRMDELGNGKLSDADVEREAECGICMETNGKVVLPNCTHSLCLKCYRDWHGRSRSCPFCRKSLKGVNLTDLWTCVESSDIIEQAIISTENSKRLFMYIDKLPLVGA